MTDQHPYLDGPHPRAYAHRGWHLGATATKENAFSAFAAAVSEGFTYLETDVHATKDGVVVAHHDERLDRTTDTEGAIADLPWAAVREAKIDGNEPVPALRTLLTQLPNARFNIDVKADDAVESTLRVIDECDAFERVCLASFSDSRLATLRGLAGSKLLTSMGPKSALALWLGAHLPTHPFAHRVHGSLAQVPLRQGPLPVVTKSFVSFAHQRGAEVHVWTIDDRDQMVELLDRGVDGLVTDRPDLLREVLMERGQWV